MQGHNEIEKYSLHHGRIRLAAKDSVFLQHVNKKGYFIKKTRRISENKTANQV
jgi:hypothetical protein